jgi:hypothetical protein
VQKGANKKVAATRDFDGSGQQALTASSQPATRELSATVSPSTSPAAAKSLPASNKLCGLIPDQTTGVAVIAASFRCASAIFLNKFHTRPPKAHGFGVQARPETPHSFCGATGMLDVAGKPQGRSNLRESRCKFFSRGPIDTAACDRDVSDTANAICFCKIKAQRRERMHNQVK